MTPIGPLRVVPPPAPPRLGVTNPTGRPATALQLQRALGNRTCANLIAVQCEPVAYDEFTVPLTARPPGAAAPHLSWDPDEARRQFHLGLLEGLAVSFVTTGAVLIPLTLMFLSGPVGAAAASGIGLNLLALGLMITWDNRVDEFTTHVGRPPSSAEDWARVAAGFGGDIVGGVGMYEASQGQTLTGRRFVDPRAEGQHAGASFFALATALSAAKGFRAGYQAWRARGGKVHPRTGPGTVPETGTPAPPVADAATARPVAPQLPPLPGHVTLVDATATPATATAGAGGRVRLAITDPEALARVEAALADGTDPGRAFRDSPVFRSLRFWLHRLAGQGSVEVAVNADLPGRTLTVDIGWSPPAPTTQALPVPVPVPMKRAVGSDLSDPAALPDLHIVGNRADMVPRASAGSGSGSGGKPPRPGWTDVPVGGGHGSGGGSGGGRGSGGRGHAPPTRAGAPLTIPSGRVQVTRVQVTHSAAGEPASTTVHLTVRAGDLNPTSYWMTRTSAKSTFGGGVPDVNVDLDGKTITLEAYVNRLAWRQAIEDPGPVPVSEYYRNLHGDAPLPQPPAPEPAAPAPAPPLPLRLRRSRRIRKGRPRPRHRRRRPGWCIRSRPWRSGGSRRSATAGTGSPASTGRPTRTSPRRW